MANKTPKHKVMLVCRLHTAHSSYRCEYHVVFAPKYRRKVIYNEIKKDAGEILRKLCNEMKVEIIEAEACPDHIHMLISFPPYMSVIPPENIDFRYRLAQERILAFCQHEPKGILEIGEMFCYRDKKTVRKYLDPLLASGRLARTVPDKPNSRNQKYITARMI